MFLAYHVQGYLVGNPVTDFNFDDPSRIPFAHGMGFLSDEILLYLRDHLGADRRVKFLLVESN